MLTVGPLGVKATGEGTMRATGTGATRPGVWRWVPVLVALATAGPAWAQQVTVTPDTSAAGRRQTLDGFGTCLSGKEGQQSWWQHLYFDDLKASILRVDITPVFASPWSDLRYVSPWFGQAAPLALPGPDGNNVRTYTGAADYTRSFGGHSAPIAVMGPDIDQNLKDFDFGAPGPLTEGTVAAMGTSLKAKLGDFKLIGSMWSPAPWLKVLSGNSIQNQSDPLPKNGTPWPFIWGGNFAGGHLDTSGTPRAEFDDSALGGTGPTSALTQYARSLAAWLRGFQDTYGVKFYAVSLQNELGFEEFYNSCSYPQAAAYLKVLEAARAELDAYPDLKDIKIMGPEDLLGGGPYGMWQYGGGATATDKNLKILEAIDADPVAAKDLSFFCIHGYAPDGVASAGAAPTQWQWWRDGWTQSPAAGLPATLKGFSAYGKKSWMTETSGEQTAWLSPATGFPGKGAFGVALEIEQALTTGDESAWVYWQLTDGKPVAGETLTDATALDTSPKYVAAKHFFRFIRPGSVRVATAVSGSSTLSASTYLDDATSTLVVELINASDTAAQVDVAVPADPAGLTDFAVTTSSDGALWQQASATASGGTVSVTVPGYGVATLVGQGQQTTGGSDGGVGDGGSTAGSSDGGSTAGSGDGGSTAGTGDGGLAADGGTGATGAGAGPGCGCAATSSGPAGSGPAGAVAFLLLAVALRRRRGRGPGRMDARPRASCQASSRSVPLRPMSFH